MQQPDRGVKAFRKTEQDQRKRDIFREIGMDSHPAKKRRIASVTKRRTGVATHGDHPHRQNDEGRCEQGSIQGGNVHH